MNLMMFDKQGNPIDFIKFAELTENRSYRILGRDEFPNGSYLSTIWVGINTALHGKEIFETMFFDENGNTKSIGRWETESEAIKQHQKAKSV
jgi:hypothetical protein